MKYSRLLALLTLLLPLNWGFTGPDHVLSICATFENEDEYLKEWIEFHRIIGVDHFYLYDLGNEDSSKSVLKPYIEDGVVTLTRWNLPLKKDSLFPFKWSLGVQVPAYEHAIKVLAHDKTKWLIFLEVNEFLLPLKGDKVTSFLSALEQYPGVILSSDYFDGYSLDYFPRKKLVTESIERIGKPYIHPQLQVNKTIFQPNLCKQFSWPPYQCYFYNNQKPIQLSKNFLRINRYWNRFKGVLDFSKNGSVFFDLDKIPYHTKTMLIDSTPSEDSSEAMDRLLPKLRERLGHTDI